MKPWIAEIHAYVPGAATSADGRALVKLSANENPLGCSPAVSAALAEGEAPQYYPDPDAGTLRAAIGAQWGIDPSRIVCGTGSGELLQCAVQGFAGAGDEVLFPRFSFSLYPLLAHKVAATPVMADTPDYYPSVDTLLAAVSERTRVVLLDNPNNPLGGWLPAAEVARLHAGLPGDVLLVVDQAYAEFVAEGDPDGALALAGAHDNVLVMRTFSKAYGLAGERIGWATGAPALVGALNRLRGAFNVTQSGQRAALAALGDQAFVAAVRAANRAARDGFVAAMAALGNHGIRTAPSEANFLLVLFEGALTAGTAQTALENGGYAVRRLGGLGEALRITIGTAEQMRDVARIIRDAAEAAR